jgi:hypothetical protein
VKRRAQRLTDRRCNRRQLLQELDERMAEAIAEVRSREKHAQTLGGLSKPSVRMPRTREDESCWEATC